VAGGRGRALRPQSHQDGTAAAAVCAHPVRTVTLRVFPPGQRRAQFLPLALDACLHHRVLRVRPVHSGTGIPGFTIR
jgi:hypothetical protein